MLIVLNYSGTTVQEIDSDAIVDEVIIGRSKDCAWRIPSEDAAVGRRHVKLTRCRNGVALTDLGSKNGTFCKGKRIKSIRLKPGIQVTFGNCLLTVDEATSTSGQRVAPWVTVTSGRFRGEKRLITDARFTIGSDPDSSLVLLDDMLVSRNHAEILRKDDGSCWINDLKSTNGTKVNDVPLRSGKERMLQDGDRVEIAHVEFRFHNGSSITFDWRIWMRLAAMGLTLMIAVGLYHGYQRFIRNSAAEYIAEARGLAARKCFAEALEVLDKADSSRGIKNRRMEVESLRGLLPLWESTVRHWVAAQSSLAARDWVTSSRHLAALSASGKEAWAWDSQGDGIEIRNAALMTKSLLDSFLAASSALRREDGESSYLLSRYDTLRDMLETIPDPVPSDLEQLSGAMHKCQEDFAVVVSDVRALDAAVESLASWNPPPPLDQAIRTVEEIGKRSGGAIKKRADLLIEPIMALKTGLADLRRTIDMVHDLQFDEAIRFEPGIPSAGLCAVHPRLSALRESLLNSSLNLRTQAETVAHLFRRAENATGDACFKPGMQWRNETIMEKVLSCDSLQLPFPKRSRRDPAGEYDRYLGIEEFFEYLRSGESSSQSSRGVATEFRTLLSCSADAVRHVDALAAFLGEQNNAWLLKGNLRRSFLEMTSILPARNKIVESMIDETRAQSERRRIVAAGIALRLSSNIDEISVFDRPLKMWVQEEFKRLRTELLRLNSEYDYATPDRQIQIREEILRRGIPGDPIVKRMWVQKFAAQDR